MTDRVISFAFIYCTYGQPFLWFQMFIEYLRYVSFENVFFFFLFVPEARLPFHSTDRNQAFRVGKFKRSAVINAPDVNDVQSRDAMPLKYVAAGYRALNSALMPRI